MTRDRRESREPVGLRSPAHGFCDDDETRRLLRSRPPRQAFGWAERYLGARVTSSRALRGGYSPTSTPVPSPLAPGSSDHSFPIRARANRRVAGRGMEFWRLRRCDDQPSRRATLTSAHGDRLRDGVHE